MSKIEEKLEIFAIVELFGHTKIAGRVTEQNIAGTNMLRVDVPETSANPSFTRFFGSDAIYAINPVTEEVSNAYAERLSVKPIQVYDIDKMVEKKMLQLQSQQVYEKIKLSDADDDGITDVDFDDDEYII